MFFRDRFLFLSFLLSGVVLPCDMEINSYKIEIQPVDALFKVLGYHIQVGTVRQSIHTIATNYRNWPTH